MRTTKTPPTEQIETVERRDQISKRLTFVILSGLIIFAGLFSWFFLSQASLRLDEAQSLWQTSHTPAKILSIIAQDVHVPFYHLLLHFWQVAFGNAVEAGRTFSLIFFLLTIPAIYLLGKKTFDKRVGLFAAALFALSPFLNWYGSEIRMYSLLTFITVLSQLFFTRLYKDKDAHPSTAVWIGYTIVAFLGIYTHYFFFLILISQAIFFLFRRKLFPPNALRNFILIGLLLGALFAPWLLYVKSLGSASQTQPLLVKPNSVNVFNAFSEFLFGFQNDRINTLLVSLWPLTIILGFLSLRKGRRVQSHSLYFFLSFLIPVVLAFVLSISLKPVFLSRYLIIVVPSLYLFLSWSIAKMGKPYNKIIQTSLILIFITALALQSSSASSPVKENYRGAVEYLQQEATPQDVVIVSAPFTIYPIEYYYTGYTKLTTLPIWDRFTPAPRFNESLMPEQIKTLTNTKRRAYVLLSFDQGYKEKVRLYLDQNYQKIDEKQFSPGLTLYVYQIRYDIPQ